MAITYKLVTEAPVALPFVLSRETAIPIIRAAYEAKALQKQMDPKGTAKYKTGVGPCAVGACIPDELGIWIDDGNVTIQNGSGYTSRAYDVSDMIAAGVFAFSGEEEGRLFQSIQASHDSMLWDAFEEFLDRTP